MPDLPDWIIIITDYLIVLGLPFLIVRSNEEGQSR